MRSLSDRWEAETMGNAGKEEANVRGAHCVVAEVECGCLKCNVMLCGCCHK